MNKKFPGQLDDSLEKSALKNLAHQVPARYALLSFWKGLYPTSGIAISAAKKLRFLFSIRKYFPTVDVYTPSTGLNTWFFDLPHFYKCFTSLYGHQGVDVFYVDDTSAVAVVAITLSSK